MSAELVDPFATPHEPDLTPDEWVAIRDEIHDRPWNDPTRFQECLTEALKALGEVGLQGDQFSRRTATQALRRMVYRAKTGVPYGALLRRPIPTASSSRRGAEASRWPRAASRSASCPARRRSILAPSMPIGSTIASPR